MRLRDWEVEAIRNTALEVFGPVASVRLFGSRLDDDKRGGDIDLYLDADRHGDDQNLRNRFSRLLQQRLGERAIDIVYARPSASARSIDQVARAEGIVL
jgi:predicted nucleotidyltransferase